ncbi:hypothetical protein HHL24_17030 [Paraburkholderia sp. RP-4-7]|uniref:Uncharacterized protein n=1 Tax=Paraburkholderia polaris TaxID=2728848 RepID=A0A848IEN3_9BURK|nr:hypothetical protein [Paraburkholderia polaris]NML99632.1 hypothetical protein [Paraburkholderia polaris]
MAKTIVDKMPTRADVLREATDDLGAVAEVLGWINTLVLHIDEHTGSQDSDPWLQLLRIKELAGLARYLSTSWRGEAENMASKFEEALTEVRHA